MAYTISKDEVIDYPAGSLRDFHVYCFEWIDNLHFIHPPEEFLPLPESQLNLYLEAARQRFKSIGWDGDGEIGVLWLPPFVFPRKLRISPVGILVWHVKQTEDGISWLLSPIELPFEEFGHKVG
jgi:hypothetical protein